jgi:hypothetical protein
MAGSYRLVAARRLRATPNTACTGRGSAPRFRRHLARFGAIMAQCLARPPRRLRKPLGAGILLMDEFATLVGKLVVVALNLRDDEGIIQGLNQVHGRVIRASQAEGIILYVQRDRKEFRLPPQPNALQATPPGKYRESHSGEAVMDPDFITIWDVTVHSKEKGGGTSWKAGARIQFPPPIDPA